MRRKRIDGRIRFIALGVFVAGFLFAFLMRNFKNTDESVKAANLANFDPGYIISDWQMGNYTSMSEAEIQAFLTAKNPCANRDYNFYLQMVASTNRVTWHWENGHFVCLSEERFGDGEVIGSGETAAHIIWQAAQDYKINPQVLLVLLEKEQGLITDNFPHSGQYKTATGYGCPDTAPCAVEYFGFKNQIRKAASLFRTVLDGGWTNYPLGNNYVQYNPNPACGGTVVNIRNLATSALYRYTPYQPNPGAIAVGYGTVHCGAYGNRNFYLYFEDWFGGITREKVSLKTILENTATVPDEITDLPFVYNVYMQGYDWQGTTGGGKMLGTIGYALPIEGFAMALGEKVGIQYRMHVKNVGWETEFKRDGAISGYPGSGLSAEAIQMSLHGEMEKRYDIYYRVHAQDIGWMDWVKNGAVAGTTGLSKQLEAIQVKIVRKETAVLIEEVSEKVHVQDIGWMDWVKNGAMAGTTGLSKRLEAIEIKLDDAAVEQYDILYRVHAQDIGWMDWVKNGELSGTIGRSKRLEAIEIKLDDVAAAQYDILYRVHAQDIGWMDWVKNGAMAGTTGLSKRLEAIEIKIVEK